MSRAYLFYVLRFLSKRNTDRGGRRVRSAVLAVALSLVPLVAVVEVSGGMVEGITARYLEIGSFHLQVRFFGDIDSERIEALQREIAELDGVERAFGVIEGIGLANAGGERLGVTIRGIPESVLREDPGFAEYLSIRGAVPEGAGIALSQGVSDAMGAAVGDEVTLVVARTLASGRFLLRQHVAEVSAVFTTGYADLDGQSVLVSYETGAKLFPDTSSRLIGVKVADPFGPLDSVVRRIQRMLPIGAYVYSWRELERGMYATFRTTRSLLIIVMSVIVCVAGITISSSLFILVSERETEIALLRSVGARSSGIRTAFVLLGFLTGVIGAAVGIAVGLGVSLGINEIFRAVERLIAVFTLGLGSAGDRHILDPAFYLQSIPVEPRFSELLIIAASSITLSVISAWIPARRAGMIVPARSLHRH